MANNYCQKEGHYSYDKNIICNNDKCADYKSMICSKCRIDFHQNCSFAAVDQKNIEKIKEMITDIDANLKIFTLKIMEINNVVAINNIFREYHNKLDIHESLVMAKILDKNFLKQVGDSEQNNLMKILKDKKILVLTANISFFVDKINVTIIAIGGGAGAGFGGSLYRGGGGSGCLSIKNCTISGKIDVVIGQGGKGMIYGGDHSAMNGSSTTFGDYLSVSGGFGPSGTLSGGIGGSGGGAGNGSHCAYNNGNGGNGGSGGSDGQNICNNWTGGKGLSANEYDHLKKYNFIIRPGNGGRGGSSFSTRDAHTEKGSPTDIKNQSSHSAGGGAGGIVLLPLIYSAINPSGGNGEEEGEVGRNYGQGGEGFGAGGGGGSCNGKYNKGGDGAPGCIILIKNE